MRILFVCTGNTCRSVFAEYLGRKFFDDTFEFASAGIAPQRASEASNAVFTLQNTFGIDASAHRPRDVRTLDIKSFDLVIAIDKNAAAVVQELGIDQPRLKVWPIRDPWGGDLAEYDKTALEIRRRLADLKRSLT